ncbi:hypothetical protein [Xanthomonas arboricola]|uniref:hypothetical protein n=1 Tax=Xanthomonas arboricola TaxID=56448 RepID=UPI0015E391F0|nr:hypothetical protein [Xanthomonas arboricola]
MDQEQYQRDRADGQDDLRLMLLADRDDYAASDQRHDRQLRSPSYRSLQQGKYC